MNKLNWFFCEECDSISYIFDCCGNTICNGSGCEKCVDSEISREIMDFFRTANETTLEEMKVCFKKLNTLQTTA